MDKMVYDLKPTYYKVYGLSTPVSHKCLNYKPFRKKKKPLQSTFNKEKSRDLYKDLFINKEVKGLTSRVTDQSTGLATHRSTKGIWNENLLKQTTALEPTLHKKKR